MVSDRSRLFEARTDEVGLLGDANQQGGDRWMLVARVSGPLRLQPDLCAQTALQSIDMANVGYGKFSGITNSFYRCS